MYIQNTIHYWNLYKLIKFTLVFIINHFIIFLFNFYKKFLTQHTQTKRKKSQILNKPLKHDTN